MRVHSTAFLLLPIAFGLNEYRKSLRFNSGELSLNPEFKFASKFGNGVCELEHKLESGAALVECAALVDNPSKLVH